MDKHKVRKSTKLHCNRCGKLRIPMSFLAIETENLAETPKAIPYNLRDTLEKIKSDVNYKLPRFYVAVCGICGTKTFFEGKNHGKALTVVDQ